MSQKLKTGGTGCAHPTVMPPQHAHVPNFCLSNADAYVHRTVMLSKHADANK